MDLHLIKVKLEGQMDQFFIWPEWGFQYCSDYWLTMANDRERSNSRVARQGGRQRKAAPQSRPETRRTRCFSMARGSFQHRLRWPFFN